MKILCLFALLSSAAFGSIDLTGKTASNGSITANNNDCRKEFRLQGLSTSYGSQTNFISGSSDNCGFVIYADASGRLEAYLDQQTGQTGPCAGQPFLFPLSSYTTGFAVIRVQRTRTGNSGAGLPAFSMSAETWDGATGIYVPSFATGTTSGVCTFGGFAAGPANGSTLNNFVTAFAREYTSLVPLQSTMPVTAADRNNTGCVYSWQFNSSLADSCGSFAATVTSPSYVSPGAGVTLVVSTPQVCDTPYTGATRPTWSNWISARVGVTNCVQGTSSFSQALASSFVTYAWSQTAGASFTLSSSTAGAPTFTPPSFGSYTLHLVVTDAASNMAATDLNFGAVSMDSAGVVQMPGLAGQVFGSQIAFGRNPWSYYDQQNQYAICQMVTATGCAGWFNSNYDKTWATLGTGTISSYPFSGVGIGPAPATGTTLTSGINATAELIPIADTSKLSLSSLPTWIMIGSFGQGTFELIRIDGCTTSGNPCPGSGAANLHVAYDGRGMSGNNAGIYGRNGTYPAWPGPAATWSMGATVGEYRIQGSGTKFGTDTIRPVCPAGLPGPPGLVVAGTSGTVTFTGSSATVTGSGTAFVAGMVGDWIRVNATHGGGTAFVFWRQITAVGSGTSMTMDHPARSDIDGTSFSYTITSPLYLMLQANSVTDNHAFNVLQVPEGCESDTVMFGLAAHDVPAYDGVSMPITGTLGYSYKLGLWYNSSGTSTPNFYGVGLAGLLYYYRSGDPLGLTLSNQINQYATRDPEVADGIAGQNSVLVLGGPVIGTMACLITGDCPTLVEQNLNGAGLWSQVEPFAVQGEIGSEGCNADDTRDTGYQTSWLTMAANWDANLTNRAAFTTALGSVLTRDQGCIRTLGQGYSAAVAGSFANGFVWAPIATIGLTGGGMSRAVTGTGLTGWSTSTPSTNATCYGVDEGTLTVTHGLSTATIASVTTNSGTMTPQTTGAWSGNSPTMIWFNDGSQDGVLEYTFSGTAVQLSGVWTGASGTYGFMTTGGGAIVNGGQTIGGLGAIGVDNTDDLAHNTALSQSWACRQTSGTTANLFKAWPGTTGSYSLSYYNIQAFGQQPFMLGVKAIQINWAKYNSNPTVVSGYAAAQAPVGNWFQAYAVDWINSRGTAYDAIGSACGAITDVAAGSFGSIHSFEGCGPFGLASGSASIARSDSAEGANAMQLAFIANPTETNRNNLANFYGAIYGAPGTCSTAVMGTCDGSFAAQLLTLDGAKWPGFFFGTGGLAGGSIPALLAENQGSGIFGPGSMYGPGFFAKETPQRKWRFVPLWTVLTDGQSNGAWAGYYEDVHPQFSELLAEELRDMKRRAIRRAD